MIQELKLLRNNDIKGKKMLIKRNQFVLIFIFALFVGSLLLPNLSLKRTRENISKNVFLKASEKFKFSCLQQFQNNLWINKPFDEVGLRPSIFLQKLVVSPGSIIFVRGDLHGDFVSLEKNLKYLQREGFLDKNDKYKIIKPGFYMAFLGDYIDRGESSVEVLHTLFQLKISNPEQVILIRGNHEDKNICCRYGFYDELCKKYGYQNGSSVFNQICDLFYLLPSALFLGVRDGYEVNYMIFCHGGVDPAIDPKPLLANESSQSFLLVNHLNFDLILPHLSEVGTREAFNRVIKKRFLRKSGLANFKINEDHLYDCSFFWSDFAVGDETDSILSGRGRGFLYGKKFFNDVLRFYSQKGHFVRGVFRAHQHYPWPNKIMRLLKENNGVCKLWGDQGCLPSLSSGAVYTFLVAPNTPYGQSVPFSFDTFGLLHTSADFNNWKMDIINL